MRSLCNLLVSLLNIIVLSLAFLSLYAVTGLADIAGYVYDDEGNPLEGAWVTTQGAVSVKSAANGFFLQSITSGTHTVTASMPGHVSQTQANVLSSGTPTPIDFILPQALSMSPNLGLVGQPRDFTLHGSGFDAETKAWAAYDFTNSALTFSVANLGGWPGGYAYDVKVLDTIAYVAVDSGIKIVDVSDPSDPKNLASVSTPGPARAIAVVGDTAYLAIEDYGLRLIDISDPAKPLPIGDGLDTPGKAVDIVVADNIVYIAAWDAGLHIIDVGTPSSPELLKSVDTGVFAAVVAVEGNTVYVAEVYDSLIEDIYLYVVDVTTPASPQVITTEPMFPLPTSISVVNHKAYITTRNGLEIWDVSVPDTPTFITAIGRGLGSFKDVTLADSIAYVADNNNGLIAFDVSTLSEPAMVGIVLAPQFGYPQGVAVKNNIAYVAIADSGLQIIDVSDITVPQATGHIDTPIARDVTLVGNTAYVGNWWEDAFQIIDVSDPADPQYIGGTQLLGGGTDLTVAGDYAYVASGGLVVVDISTPSAPVRLFRKYLPNGSGLALKENIAYVAYQDGLQLYNVSDPTDPIALGSVSTPGSFAKAVKVVGDIAYVADWDGGLQLINVSDTSSPSIISQVDDIINYGAGEATDVFVADNIAYVVDGYILWLVNVSNVNAPQVSGIVYFSQWCNGVFVANDRAYVAHLNGFDVIDVSNASSPKNIGTLASLSTVNNVIMANDNIYVAADSGLTIMSPFQDYFAEISLQYNAASPDQLTVPGLQRNIAGDYNLSLLKSSGAQEELTGAFSFTSNAGLFHAKAIIVAGGGENASGDIWQQTKDYANTAYATLKYQGYGDDQIRYLTDQANALGRDGPADKTGLQAAFTWAKTGSTSTLIVYFVDHGEEKRFQIRGGALAQYVTVEELNGWLNDFQYATDAKVLFVYDACKSGSFTNWMRPPEGQKRVTITSSSAEQGAYFLSQKGSFSSHFWSVFSGKAGERVDIPSAWNRASSTMGLYQSAQLDANGNGVANEPGDMEALQSLDFPFGREWLDDNQRRPEITSVSEDQILTGDVSSALLKAIDPHDFDSDLIVRVWAEILPPDLPPPDDALTVTSAIEVDLVETTTPGVYEADYDNFNIRGTYIITYYALDEDGLVSLPKTSLITQTSGTVKPIVDHYEPDDGIDEAKVIDINAPSSQNHSFHVAGDEDWLVFYGVESEVYTIRAMNPTILSDPVIRIYAADGTTLKASSNSFGPGKEESLDWACPQDSIYYVQITNSSGYYGANVRYRLKMYSPEAFSLLGYITGRITSGGKAVGGAVIRAGNGTAITLPDGSFILSLKPGSYMASVTCNGYQSTSFSVNLESGKSVSLSSKDINSIPQILNFPPGLVKANEMYSYTPSVIDVDGDSLNFSITNKPVWASFSILNGMLWGKPSAVHQGTYGPITITVSDNSGASDSVSFKIRVAKGTAGALPGVFLLLQNKK